VQVQIAKENVTGGRTIRPNLVQKLTPKWVGEKCSHHFCGEAEPGAGAEGAEVIRGSGCMAGRTAAVGATVCMTGVTVGENAWGCGTGIGTGTGTGTAVGRGAAAVVGETGTGNAPGETCAEDGAVCAAWALFAASCCRRAGGIWKEGPGTPAGAAVGEPEEE
jgi:hypothetical protein